MWIAKVVLKMFCGAVGDIHGDLRKAISSLEAARVLQEVGGQVRWAGGDTVVVQLGDVLDRGDSEIGDYSKCPATLELCQAACMS